MALALSRRIFGSYRKSASEQHPNMLLQILVDSALFFLLHHIEPDC